MAHTRYSQLNDPSKHVDMDHGSVAKTLDHRRRAALEEIDRAPFSRFHLKVACVAGVGFLTDAYDIFAISIASTMIGLVHGAIREEKVGFTLRSLSSSQELAIKVATPVGTLFGQLFFGWLADILGRKRMYGIELIIMIIATFSQALAGSSPGVSILGVLIFWRFVMGVGIGGDYPLSAVISSEFSSTHIRGRLMTAVFACQGWGNLLACFVGLTVVAGFRSSLTHSNNELPLEDVDNMWRILIGLGCLPAAVALYYRLTIPETPRFTMDIERNMEQATQDVTSMLATGTYYVDPDAVIQRVNTTKASTRDFRKYFGKWENFKVLFAASFAWFSLDVAFYGLNLNSSIVLQAMGYADTITNVTNTTQVADLLKNICVGNTILSIAGHIPGYWVSFLLIDKWGRKPIQLIGFAFLTVILCVIGFAWDSLYQGPDKGAGLVVLFCLANFFSNFGPNTTTFIIPGEAFPTRYRSTSHGIAAASGKLGAIIAQVGFAKLKDIHGTNEFVKHILEIFAFFTLAGLLVTLLLPETKGRTLEDVSNESQDGFVHELRAHNPRPEFSERYGHPRDSTAGK